MTRCNSPALTMSKPLPRFASVRMHGQIRVRLHRETNQVVERRERGIQLLKMILQRALRIDVKRRAEFFRERLDAHAFAEQFVSDVTKIVHEAAILECGGQSSRPGNKKPAGNISGGLWKKCVLRLG